MKVRKITVFVLIFLQIFASTFLMIPKKVYAFSNPVTVPLLTVSNFAALAHTLVSSPTGPTVLNNGNMGVDSPGTCTGFPSPCTASGNGTINSGAIQYQNAVALQGQTDATTAVTNIGSRAADQTLSAQLGGQTLTQGVYQVPAAATNLTGDLTLSGDASSVFIFHLTSTLITDTGSRVLLTGGVQPCNVFWKVDSSATFNGTTTFVGTVLAQASVSFPGGGATVNGRIVAQTGAITFNNTTVNNSSCSTASSNSSSSSSSNSNINLAPFSICPTITDQIISPNIISSRRVNAKSIFISWGPYSGTDKFNVRYGPTIGNWLYNVDVTGFSTTINDLPANQPIWVQVAARNDCMIANYGNSKLVGGPGLPNTGFISSSNNVIVYFLAGLFAITSTLFVSIRKK
jgi:hypothetical protein